jgi:hypothetical protein
MPVSAREVSVSVSEPLATVMRSVPSVEKDSVCTWPALINSATC